MYNYNPLQSQYELLNRRKQELDSQMAMIQNQMNQQPPINQTFQITSPQPAVNNQFDFNGKVANGIEEAKSISCNNLPVIIMDANEPKFYMRNLDGSFKTYTFQEYKEPEPVNKNDEIETMKQSIQQLQENFSILVSQLAGATQPANTEPVTEPKTTKRTGGKKNEQSNNQ